MANDEKRKPTAAEQEEAFKAYLTFRGKFKGAVLALYRVRLQRYAGLSYVEANVQSLWRSGIKTKSIAEKADRTEKGVWRINARAEMKIEESGYRVDGDLLTWLSQNSSYFTYTPRRDPLFGNISEPYCRFSR